MESESITAMVCSRGESPTTHTNQMKLIKVLILMSAVFLTAACQPYSNALTYKQYDGDGSGGFTGDPVFEGKVVIDGMYVNWLSENGKEVATETKLSDCSVIGQQPITHMCTEINKSTDLTPP